MKRCICILLALCLSVALAAGVSAAQFTDVAPDAYYAEAVQWAADRGITTGTTATTFSPDETCTRAQMVTFLWRASGSPAPSGSRMPFSDVPADAYYRDAVLWAVEQGVTEGTSTTTFSPNATVTRAQAVTFLWRAAGKPVSRAKNPFTDVPSGTYYTEAVLWAAETGVTTGVTPTTFRPNDPCTRAQIVTFLYRAAFLDRDGAAALTHYPVVLVHGLFGYGEYDDIDAVMPYWGLTSGSIAAHLRAQGAEVYCASVGPFSSAWDRACELYAQLAGTVTDYGAAHAAAHGHDRYGRDYTGGTYSKLLAGQWDAAHPVNLVGHSFGGATCRLLLDLLADGSADERAYMAAHPEAGAISPLFTGGKANWVYSLTALAAPANGMSVFESNALLMDVGAQLTEDASKLLGLTAFKGVYDSQLEHFGIQPKPGEGPVQALHGALTSDFLTHNDNAYQDLTVDKCMALNQDIEMQPNVYYFSYYGNRTVYSSATGGYVPTSKMLLMFQPLAASIGAYTGTTSGTFTDGYGSAAVRFSVTPTKLDATWQPSDGLVNVISCKWPFHYENGARVDDAHIIVSTQTVRAAQRGVWYVFPEQDMDHMSFQGGVFNENASEIMAFYDGVLENIIRCGG